MSGADLEDSIEDDNEEAPLVRSLERRGGHYGSNAPSVSSLSPTNSPMMGVVEVSIPGDDVEAGGPTMTVRASPSTPTDESLV